MGSRKVACTRLEASVRHISQGPMFCSGWLVIEGVVPPGSVSLND